MSGGQDFCTSLTLNLALQTMVEIVGQAEVEITGGHRAFSVHLIGMTDHSYTWSVGVTDYSIG